MNVFGELNTIIDLLKKVTDFLIQFKTTSDELEEDISPILHKVLLYKTVLENTLINVLWFGRKHV